MTNQEYLHIALKEDLQELSSFAYDDFHPEQIDFHLNRAVLDYIGSKYWKYMDSRQHGFEESLKRLADLQTLVARKMYPSPVQIEGTTCQVALPGAAEHLYPITGIATLHNPDTGKTYKATIEFLEHEQANSALKNPFKAPDENAVIGLIEANTLNITFTERYILKGIEYTYIRKPNEIDISSQEDWKELPDHALSKIAEITVQRILSATASQRYQQYSVESGKRD